MSLITADLIISLTNLICLQDLSGLAVSSVSTYLPRLQTRYGLIASEASISTIEDVRATAELVAQGKLAAFL